jgi:hypothetical protein
MEQTKRGGKQAEFNQQVRLGFRSARGLQPPASGKDARRCVQRVLDRPGRRFSCTHKARAGKGVALAA